MKRHPGYIIGNHWLEAAYERICTSEEIDAVLAEYGWVRMEFVNAATEMEREACARACELLVVCDETYNAALGNAALSIRNRGKT